jgi:hypothetical protein
MDPAQLRFTDVTAQSGIKPAGYEWAAAGDIDNDGRPAIY